jgi:hypothetical protein
MGISTRVSWRGSRCSWETMEGEGKEKEKPESKIHRVSWWTKRKEDSTEIKADEENDQEKKLDNASGGTTTTSIAEPMQQQQQSLELRDIDFEIPRGQLCAIVGPGWFFLMCDMLRSRPRRAHSPRSRLRKELTAPGTSW